MKNFKTFFTIIAIGAVFGLMLSACKTDTDDPAGGGDTLEGTWVATVSGRQVAVTFSGNKVTYDKTYSDNTATDLSRGTFTSTDTSITCNFTEKSADGSTWTPLTNSSITITRSGNTLTATEGGTTVTFTKKS